MVRGACLVVRHRVVAKVDKNSEKFDFVRSTTNPRCKQYDHVVCKRNYGSLSRRWAKDVGVKLWWEAKSSDEQGKWYREHHGLDTVGEVRPINVDRREVERSGTRTGLVDQYVDWTGFKRNGFLERKDLPAITKEWNEKLRDGNHLKQMRKGEIFIFDCRKLDVEAFDEKLQEKVVADSREATSVEELRSMVEAENEAMAKFKRRRDSRWLPAVAPDAPVLVPGAIRGMQDENALMPEVGALEAELMHRSEEQAATLDVIQELVDLDDRDIEIFRLEQADSIKSASPAKSLDGDKKKQLDKMRTFMRGTFATKLDSHVAEAQQLAAHCDASWKQEAVEGSDWLTKLNETKEVPETMKKLAVDFQAKVDALVPLINDAVNTQAIEHVCDEWDKVRLKHWAEFKESIVKVARLCGLVKKREQQVRAASSGAKSGSTKARKGQAPQPVDDQGVDDSWAKTVDFVVNTFSVSTPKAFVKPFAVDLTKAAAEVAGNSVTKALLAWSVAQCRTNSKKGQAAAMSQTNHRVHFEAKILGAVVTKSPQIFAKPFSATDVWLQEVFYPSVTHFTAGYKTLSMTPYGLPLTSLVLSGDLILGGLLLEGLPGATLDTKVKHVQAMSIDDLTEKFKHEPNFIFRASTGSLVHVPSGYLLLQATGASVDLVRWSSLYVLRAAFKHAVQYLSLLMQGNPSLQRIETYPALLKFLQEQSEILPA
jgi:hypothetical protein